MAYLGIIVHVICRSGSRDGSWMILEKGCAALAFVWVILFDWALVGNGFVFDGLVV
jgi:hypothetical protein